MIFYFITEDLFRILSIQFLQNFFHTLWIVAWSLSELSSLVNGAAYHCAPLQLIKLGNQAIRLGGMLPSLLMLLSAPGMACGSRYSYVDAHDCRSHRRIPPQSGTVPPPS